MYRIGIETLMFRYHGIDTFNFRYRSILWYRNIDNLILGYCSIIWESIRSKDTLIFRYTSIDALILGTEGV